MKQRQWKTTRQLVARPDAQRRIDQAYQCLMSWTSGLKPSSEAQRVQAPQEESDENSCLRPSFHPASDPDANH
jgi:hypothetical protein